MRVKAKTWGVIGKTNFTIALNLFLGLCETTKITKSQLQTVLITASGPQALNALVHRERYTQGSRQNRCVSSQKALALRAKAVGTEATSADRIRARRLGLYGVSALCTLRASGSSCPEATVSGGGYPPLLPQHGLGEKSLAALRQAKNCQLGTAYGGESNCIIKT